MMTTLFKLDSNEVVVEPEALLLTPFKKIWDRNQDNKYIAQQELAYIFFMGDPRSSFMYLTEEDTRSNEIIKGLGLPKGWKPDKIIREALDYYNSFIPTSVALVNTAKDGINTLQNLIKNTDWEAKDDDGKFINSVDSLPKLLNQVPKLIIAFDEAEKTLFSDIQQAKARGSQEKGMLEDD